MKNQQPIPLAEICQLFGVTPWQARRCVYNLHVPRTYISSSRGGAVLAVRPSEFAAAWQVREAMRKMAGRKPGSITHAD